MRDESEMGRDRDRDIDRDRERKQPVKREWGASSSHGIRGNNINSNIGSSGSSSTSVGVRKVWGRAAEGGGANTDSW